MPRSKTCPHCATGAEVFRYMSRRYVFDVDLARRFVRDGRAPVEMEPDDVRFSIQDCRIYQQHLPHVDTKYPGIVAHLWYPDAKGLVHGHLLIDGNHRAARCLQLGQPYFIHLLSEEESLRILLKSPLAPIPDLLCAC